MSIGFPSIFNPHGHPRGYIRPNIVTARFIQLACQRRGYKTWRAPDGFSGGRPKVISQSISRVLDGMRTSDPHT